MKTLTSICLGIVCSMMATRHLNTDTGLLATSRAHIDRQKQIYEFILQERIIRADRLLAVAEAAPEAGFSEVRAGAQLLEMTVLRARLHQKLWELQVADEKKWRTLRYEIEGWVEKMDELLFMQIVNVE